MTNDLIICVDALKAVMVDAKKGSFILGRCINE